jgi:hypothetical protein
VLVVAPFASVGGVHARRVVVVVRRGGLPVAHIRHGEDLSTPRVHLGCRKHVFIPWQDGLADTVHEAAVVHDLDASASGNAVWLVGEGLGDGPVHVAVQPAVGSRGGAVGGGRVPLCHQLSWRAGVGTVHPGEAGHVGAHGPAGVKRIGSDCLETSVRREGADDVAFLLSIEDVVFLEVICPR